MAIQHDYCDDDSLLYSLSFKFIIIIKNNLRCQQLTADFSSQQQRS